MIRRTSLLFGIGMLALTSAPCTAQADATDHRTAPSGSLKEENYRGIRYITGGVGAQEQEALKQLAKDYDLFIVLASKSGAYLSGVELTFRDQQGQDVLLATSRGPYFLIDLPEGRYQVSARRPGAAVEQHEVEIRGRKTQTLYFRLSTAES